MEKMARMTRGNKAVIIISAIAGVVVAMIMVCRNKLNPMFIFGIGPFVYLVFYTVILLGGKAADLMKERYANMHGNKWS